MRIHCLTCLWSAAFLCRAFPRAFISLFSSAFFSGIFATQHGSARNAFRVYTHARAYVLSMLLQIVIRLGLLRFGVYWARCKVNAFRRPVLLRWWPQQMICPRASCHASALSLACGTDLERRSWQMLRGSSGRMNEVVTNGHA